MRTRSGPRKRPATLGAQSTRCAECHHPQEETPFHYPDCRYFVLDNDADEDDVAPYVNAFLYSRKGRNSTS